MRVDGGNGSVRTTALPVLAREGTLLPITFIPCTVATINVPRGRLNGAALKVDIDIRQNWFAFTV